MRRPDFWTSFLGLLAVFNLAALWLGGPDTAVLYGAVAAGCFGLLIVKRVTDRTLTSAAAPPQISAPARPGASPKAGTVVRFARPAVRPTEKEDT